MITEASNLIERWRKWLSTPDLNRLFALIMSHWLHANPTEALSNMAALIIRLKTHGYENAYTSQSREVCDVPLEDTLEFVRSFSPRAFLRALILSEILIAWYWHKSLAICGSTQEQHL